MSTGNKNHYISSELEDLLKEVEEEHKSADEFRKNRQDRKKKKPKIRIDMIIAAVLAIAIIGTVVSLVWHFAGKSSDSKAKQSVENPLEDEKYPEISDVVKNYLNAFLIEDEQKRLQVLAQYVGNMYDISSVKYNNYVASYSDIECYTKEGPYDNTYVVYAYYQMEIKNISTTAPNITRLYVVRDTNTGNVYIQNDPSDEITAYMDKVTKDSDVQNLLKSVNQEFKEAKEADKDLKAYFDKMNTKKDENQTTAASETAGETTPTATTKASK